MRIRVTAILIVKHGGQWLTQTLAALAAQTRQADAVVAVLNGGGGQGAAQLRGVEGISVTVVTPQTIPFGRAARQAVAAIPAEATDPETHPTQHWFWLLSEDSAPEPTALAEILGAVQRAPSVAMAGPKLVSWDHPDHIIELGQSLSYYGERWLLRRQERDQQQYDHLQDVLGIGPVGMLIRADVWRQLDGFDPAYSVYDDGLDLSVRARLAGYRVVVAPTSKLRFAQLGVGGPRIDRSRRVLRVAHGQARSAQLHRRIAYAPALAAYGMWLGLPLLAVFRACWALLREHPGRIWGECHAALKVFFRPDAIAASRKRVQQANRVGWGAVRPLRVDPKSVRTARMIDREAILAAQGRLHDQLHFISGGGLAVLCVAVIAAIGLTWWALTQTSLAGGALAPLSPLDQLWRGTRAGDGVAADPFAWVLALLGTLAFWNPSHGVVLICVAAIPLAALGAWVWGARFTTHSAGRALIALGWAFSPVLLSSLAAGRLATVILVAVLPWLLLAVTRVTTSWSWVGLASLLAALVLACAPILLPAAALLLLIGVSMSPRHAVKMLGIAVAPLALFVPNMVSALSRNDPLMLLVDPGILVAFRPASIWQLLLGFPEFGLGGWGETAERFGVDSLPVTALVAVLLLLTVLLAAVALLTAGVRLTLLHAAFGGAGLLTAIMSSRLQLASSGTESVTVWAGSGIALYWIAVLGLAATGTRTLRRLAAPVASAALITAVVAIAPLAVQLATANTQIVPGVAQLPAIVQAAGAQDPDSRTLVLSAVAPGSVRANLVTGSGVRLDRVRTDRYSAALTAADQQLAELVGALASTGGHQAPAAVAGQNIRFVLLTSGGDLVERSQLQAAFDQQQVLVHAGQTPHGLLWRVLSDPEETATDRGQGELSQPQRPLSHQLVAGAVWWGQLIILGSILLLALPTGEVVERPERRRKSPELQR